MKKIYEDVLDDIDEIEPDVCPDVSEEEGPAFVAEMFDPEPYDFFVRIRVSEFRTYVPDESAIRVASEISSVIRETFGDVSLETTVSPVYVYGMGDGFGNEQYDGSEIVNPVSCTFFFGISFGRKLTYRQCIRLLLRIDFVSSFIRKLTGITFEDEYEAMHIINHPSGFGGCVLETNACTRKSKIIECLKCADKNTANGAFCMKRFADACLSMRGNPDASWNPEELQDAIHKTILALEKRN